MSGSSYVSTEDTHISEFKVRLTEADGEWLKANARKIGVKPAVLARMLIKRNLGVFTPENLDRLRLEAIGIIQIN